MKTLLIVAHGSRREESNDEIRHLAELVRQQAGWDYADVGCAFLELAEPSIPDGIQAFVDKGSEEIVVMPFFLSAGRHVVSDVPEFVKQKQREHPTKRIRMAAYLGISALMPQLILESAKTACACDTDTCMYPDCLQTPA